MNNVVRYTGNTNSATILPPTANPLRLQRVGYLFPTPPAPGGLWFVFLQPTHNPAVLPRDTSLRRALAEFLDTGATWHGGGMFLLREDLTAPAEGEYREMFDTLCQGTSPIIPGRLLK